MVAVTSEGDPAAFLAMWNDVDPAGETEYEQWHSTVHLPERVAIPGFRRSRRFTNEAAARQKYFIVYDIDDLDVLAGAEYQDLINTVEPETATMMAAFRDFTRGACRVVRRRGCSEVGGAIRVWRFDDLGSMDEAQLVDRLNEEVGRLHGEHGVTVVTAGISARSAAASGLPNREREVREQRAADGTFAALLLAETRDAEQAYRLELSESFVASCDDAGARVFSERYRLNLLVV